MNKRFIKIRVDGNSQIGLGHLVRCMALANMLKNDFDITFFCKSIPEKICTELEADQFKLSLISDESDFFNNIPHDVMVLDGYDFDTVYQKAAKRTGAKVVCIDDLHDQEFYADLVINHAPGVTPENYRAQPYTRFALGPEHVLLRPAFLERAGKIRMVTAINTVLICFGGSDSRNLTASTLEVLEDFPQFVKIIVVTGSAYVYSNTLEPLINADPRIIHYNAVSEKIMAELMLETDLAIVPSSGVLLEALSCGGIVISGKYIDNQEILFERYKKEGLFVSAENFERINIQAALRQAISLHQKPVAVFDGKSGSRLKKLFLEL